MTQAPFGFETTVEVAGASVPAGFEIATKEKLFPTQTFQGALTQTLSSLPCLQIRKWEHQISPSSQLT